MVFIGGLHPRLILKSKYATQIIVAIENAEKGKVTPLEWLNLSPRALHCLKRRDIHFVEELVLLTKDEVWRIRNMGHRTLEEINEKLKGMGYSGWE